jgi:hypothetical protein
VSEWYDNLAPTDEAKKLLDTVVVLDDGNDTPMTKLRTLALLNRALPIRNEQRTHDRD